MNRQNEIEKFLKDIHSYAKHTNTEITSDLIYSTLSNYGFSEQELHLDTKHFFDYWINNFSNHPNINVFRSDSQRNFLQFNNAQPGYSKHIKLYLSLSPDALYEGVNTVFKFIADNNMKTCSKVANCIRSDEVVIRLEDTNDAERVIEFINNNEFLRSHARPTNPFLNREGVVGVGFDDLLSYNSTFSYFISDYLNKTNNPSFEEFVNYLNNKYVNLFQNQTELQEFMQSDLFKANLNRITNGFKMINNPELYIINNYRMVFQAILHNTYQESFKELYGLINDSKVMFEKSTYVDKNKLFNDYIIYADRKYNHDLNLITKALINFSNGDYNAITRDNNFRELFVYNINPKFVSTITNNDIETYVNGLLNYLNTISFSETERLDSLDQTQDLISVDDFNMFVEGLRATYEKYGENQIIKAIPNFLDGNFNNMTNGDYNFRKYFTTQYNQDQLRIIGYQCINRLLNGRVIEDPSFIGPYVLDELVTNYGFSAPSSGGRTR